MKLSIITINFNDTIGLARTLNSVLDQRIPDGFALEHIIVDGGSTDGSVEVIKEYVRRTEEKGLRCEVKWVSEKDKGVYNAMNKGIEIALGRRKVNDFNRSELVEDKNKGIQMASGDYVQILNSGDILASSDVICKMENVICGMDTMPEILYGNMLKTKDGVHVYRDNCGRYNGTPESFLYFYRGTMNHDSAWIRRELFDRYGLYDEDMKICSDWKWYVDAVAMGGVKPVYVDIDVTIFDINGVSENGGKNKAIIQQERRGHIEQILPASVLRDYDEFAMPIAQYRRLKRWHIWSIVCFVERVFFKLEKWGILKA